MALASNMAKFVIGDDGAASISAADSSDKVGCFSAVDLELVQINRFISG